MSLMDLAVVVEIDDGDDHADIVVRPTVVDLVEEERDEPISPAENAALHFMAGIVARVATEVAHAIDIERHLHGCQVPGVYAQDIRHLDSPARVVRCGSPLREGERAHREWGDYCHVWTAECGPAPLPRLAISVPKGKRGAWRKRVEAIVDELLEAVPT